MTSPGILRPFLISALAASASALAEESPLLINLVNKGDEVIRMIGNSTEWNSTGHALSNKHHATMPIVYTEKKCSFLDRVVEATRRRRRTFRPANDEELLLAVESFPPHRNLWNGVGMSFLAGLSTILGAGIVFLLPGKQASASQMSFVLALAAGVMLSATVFEFWLPALASSSPSTALSALFFSTIGAASFLLLSTFVGEPEFIEADVEIQSHGDDHKPGQAWHLAKVLMISLTAHNFPEGFAVGVSSLASANAGFIVMLAISMHNIPEGIAIAVPVLAATGSRRKALWWTFLSGMAEPAGALLALCLAHGTGIVSHVGIENLLCVVGGVMFAAAVKELIPGAWKYGKPLSFTGGLLVGFFLMLITVACGA